MTACPKCSSRDVHKEDSQAAHGAHTSVHVLHSYPIIGLIGLIVSAAAALGFVTRYECRHCKHRF